MEDQESGNRHVDSMIFKGPQYLVKTAQARHLLDTLSGIRGIRTHVSSIGK
jgi:hypothetical protein